MKLLSLVLFSASLVLGLSVVAQPAAAFDPCGTAHCTVWQPGVCVENQAPCQWNDIVCVTNAGQPVFCVAFNCQCRPIESRAVDPRAATTLPLP